MGFYLKVFVYNFRNECRQKYTQNNIFIVMIFFEYVFSDLTATGN